MEDSDIYELRSTKDLVGKPVGVRVTFRALLLEK
jgi:hypothetical protein